MNFLFIVVLFIIVVFYFQRTDVENEERIRHLVKEKHQLECKYVSARVYACLIICYTDPGVYLIKLVAGSLLNLFLVMYI